MATATSTPVPTPTLPPTPSPTPTPSVNPALAKYSALLAKAASGLDFVRDGLSDEERNILDWADSRLFSKPAFLDSTWGPDNWPSEVMTESVQAIPLLMLEIDIERKSNGRHVVNWEVDSLDRVLDGLGIYEGWCVSCYGKRNYNTVDEVFENYYPIVYDLRHVHREMLKTFAYFAKADGEGILLRGFMENGADDLEMLHRRDLSVMRDVGSFTVTQFGWRNLSFMSQIRLPDGTAESFPTTVFRVIADSSSEREAAERWFTHFNKVMVHYTGGPEEFADLYRPHSQTPYSPEPGYLPVAGEAGSRSSTGTTVSAFQLLGFKAEQFFSPEKGRRTGGVEIDGKWFYHDGNMPLSIELPMCVFLAPLEAVDNDDYDAHCGYKCPRHLTLGLRCTWCHPPGSRTATLRRTQGGSAPAVGSSGPSTPPLRGRRVPRLNRYAAERMERVCRDCAPAILVNHSCPGSLRRRASHGGGRSGP